MKFCINEYQLLVLNVKYGRYENLTHINDLDMGL